MDARYARFCRAGSVYYERPGASGRPPAPPFGVPAGWQLLADNPWTVLRPVRPDLPPQGWKVHVSATSATAGEVLRTIGHHCLAHGIAFKYLSSPELLLVHNGKYAPRGSSGKFMALYPRDDAELTDVLETTDQLVGGLPGPRILSDLRWREGPLYLRYGGFRERFTYDADGVRVPAIEAPDGSLVPDVRLPYFAVPSWAPIPAVLQPVIEEWFRADEDADRLPFSVLSAVHFSNAGGVYQAHDPVRDLDVVLKEARPFAGLDSRGRDAVERLDSEAAALRRLRGIPGVPRLIETFSCGAHRFLALEVLDASSLSSWTARHYPYVRPSATAQARRDYEDAAATIVEQLRRILDQMHARGVAHGDVHPGNVMVDDELRTWLIDYESACAADAESAGALGAPGFSASGSRSGRERDLYSLACIELHLRLPLTTLLPLSPTKAHDLVTQAQRRFGLPAAIVPGLRRALAPAGPPADHAPRAPRQGLRFGGRSSWTVHRQSLVSAIRAQADPTRADRLFPADINVFQFGGTGYAFGAAGVIHTLAQTSGHPDLADLADHINWLLDQVQAAEPADPGLYTGLSGVSWVLRELGLVTEADRLLQRCAQSTEPLAGIKLFDGQAGLGLAMLDAYRRHGSATFGEAALACIQRVVEAVPSGTLGSSTSGAQRPTSPNGNAVEEFSSGLLYGWSGVALLLLRAYEVFRDPSLLDLSITAVHRDLDACESLPDGSLQIRQRNRVLPYVATGGAGVALVSDLVLRHRDDDRIAGAIEPLCQPALTSVCMGAGLFNGRAGFLHTLHRLRHRLPWDDLDEQIRRGVASLDLHALETDSGLVFPGEQNLRLSADVATGSAGVLRVLHSLEGGTDCVLPFMDRERWTAPDVPPTERCAQPELVDAIRERR